MVLTEFSDDTIRVYGPNSADEARVYWFSARLDGKLHSVGTLTPYGFVPYRNNWQRLTSDLTDRVNDLMRTMQRRFAHNLTTGTPGFLLKNCAFPDAFDKAYRALEWLYANGNLSVRVSLRTGQVVFDGKRGDERLLNNKSLHAMQAQMRDIGLDEAGIRELLAQVPARRRPARRAAQRVIRINAVTSSYYF